MTRPYSELWRLHAAATLKDLGWTLIESGETWTATRGNERITASSAATLVVRVKERAQELAP